MSSAEIISARNVQVKIDGAALFQAECLEIRRLCELHPVRAVFVSDDIAHIRKNSRYKANLSGLRFRQPYENISFADLDNFTLTAEIDGKRIILSSCMWDDFLAAADREKFRERISVTALSMETEDVQ